MFYTGMNLYYGFENHHLLTSLRNVIWAATSNQINRWRRHTLKLENTDMGHLAQSKITFIYNFSKVRMHPCLIAVLILF